MTTAPAETLDLGMYRGLSEDRDQVRKIVDNPEKTGTYAPDLAMTGKSLLLEGDYDYVIITNQYLKDAPGPYNFQALADHKKKKGLNAAIVTVEEIYAAYKYTYHRDDKGDDQKHHQGRNNHNGIQYVLLGHNGVIG